MLSGRAVLECARSRCVARDRAADGRLLFTRGVWGEQQSGCCYHFFDVSDDSAGTDSDRPGFDVEISDLIQGSKREQHSIVGDRRACSAGLRASGCDRNPFGGSLFHEVDYVVDRLRPRYLIRDQLKPG
jgi:hypothetical protein